MGKKKNVAPIAANAIAASLALVEKAALPFDQVVRMSAKDRSRVAKLKRGAQQVIPTIAHLANKFAVEVPGFPIEEMLTEIAHAQSLEPLLGAVAQLHAMLKDEHLRSQARAWKSATVTYGVLRLAGEANPAVRIELAPVQTWFRHAGSKKSSSNAAPIAPIVNAPVTPLSPADTHAVSSTSGVVNGVNGAASAIHGA